ncbi:hypothetical protein CI105_07660 [Candidatus Izimaplasma bacterium ZiA1]|uniref:hypothetical protein n=1 Tax=Candidatus Izimoplasma sp. ZiA1 TaxID=2024899 RepID=UPI000BAA5E19|nr:hypothetical protein CI105_07660 [Candidatus Izimaplasma bacterium ZiA1]
MKRKKVYNLFQIYLILFYTASFLIIPSVLVVSYIFDLQVFASTNRIILIADGLGLIFFIIGSLLILINRDKLERKLKPTYHREFNILLVTVSLGVLGINVLYLYLGGDIIYIPHIMIPLFVFSYLIMFIIGDRYFNVDLLKK